MKNIYSTMQIDAPLKHAVIKSKDKYFIFQIANALYF